MSFEVDIISEYRRIPEEAKAVYSEDKWNSRGLTALVVFHNAEIVDWVADSWEPEDVKFTRDLAFIRTWVKTAYKLGRRENQLQTAMESVEKISHFGELNLTKRNEE